MSPPRRHPELGLAVVTSSHSSVGSSVSSRANGGQLILSLRPSNLPTPSPHSSCTFNGFAPFLPAALRVAASVPRWLCGSSTRPGQVLLTLLSFPRPFALQRPLIPIPLHRRSVFNNSLCAIVLCY